MKLISWNVNGLRACLGKGFLDFCKEEDPAIICIQETKMQQGQAVVELEGYEQYWNSADKKGYSGTAVFTKVKPLKVAYDMQKEEVLLDEHAHEGRVITCEFEDFYLVNCYTPNSKRDLLRIDYRMQWEDDFRAYLLELDQKKPVVLCGDLNVAHEEIDLKNPKSNRGNAGFSDQERGKMTELLKAGFVDSFREMYPEREDAYSWWSYQFHAREKNVGWRIDYFLVSEKAKDRIADSVIYGQIMGSDHCPVGLDWKPASK